MKVLKQDYLSYLATATKLDYMLIDPPWRFDDRPPKMRPQTRFTLWDDNVENLGRVFGYAQYLGIDLIWLWCPVSLIDIPIQMSQGYTYKYKMAAVWKKLTKHGKEFYGCGYWLRNSVEFLLLFTRVGNKLPPMRSAHRNIWAYAASEESTAKPREMETNILNSMVAAYGKDIHGAYLFSGPEVECFKDFNIDCVDIVHGQ